MNKRLLSLLVLLAAVGAVAGYLFLAGGDSGSQTGLTGANKDVKVVSGTETQRIVEGVVRRAGKPVAGVTVEIRRGSASGELAGASATGAGGKFVFGALEQGPHVLVAKGAAPVKVAVPAGNGVTRANITLG